MTHLSLRSSHVEPLEARIALSATPLSVARALDLDDSVTVVLSGNGLSFATQSLGATGQLLGFPTGADGDFLILSTGVASQATALGNIGDAQGTDLGPTGAAGDSPSVSFSLPVPQGASNQRLKIDFMFLTEEYPEFVNSGFNDTFEILINGVNFAQDELGNPIEVDNAFFTGETAPGTFFDGRTNRLTLTYVVPEGMTSLHVELRLTEVGDGDVDSAVFVDNVRFETPQMVYLDFDGANLTNHFAPGTTAIIPAFDASDIGSAESTAALIDQIVTKLGEIYAPFDIIFTTVMPTAGDFTTLVVGGDNSAVLDISGASPLLRRQHPGSSIAVSALFGLGADSLLGFAGPPDVGNFDRNDRAVVFSGEFDDFFSEASPEDRLSHLVVTLAHELGHNLGLRHLDDAASDHIMKQTAPRSIDAVFGNTLVLLAEQWSDGATEQNDHSYLVSILGRANASGLAQAKSQSDTAFFTNGQAPLFDVTITITSSDPDAAAITLHFDRLDGSQNIPLPNLPIGAKISLTAASMLGGPLDVFSGVPQAGEITNEASAVPLFDANGNLLPVPLAKGAPGFLTNGGSLSLHENELGAVTLLTGKVGTFTDADGDTFTVRLTGPGLIGYVLDDPDNDGQGRLLRLVVDNTTIGESVLTIIVNKGRFGDGLVSIGEISGAAGAGLKLLSAPKVSLDDGGVIFSGALGTVTIRDLTNGADLIGGEGAGIKSNVTVRVVDSGSDVALGTDILNFKAACIGDAGIAAASIAKVIVAGDRVANIAGNVAGQFNIAGLLGSFTARDLLPTASISAGGGALERTLLVMHEIMDGVSIALASGVTSLKAARVGDAQISAQRFDAVAITGDLRNFIPGDFGADIQAINKIGRFTARDVLETASIAAGGSVFDKTLFTVHAIKDGVSIVLDTSVSTFRAADIGDASIRVSAIGSFLVTGDVNGWLPGDFRGTLLIEGGDEFFINAIGTARIVGSVVDATITADSIGSFTAKGMAGSEMLVGFTPADENDLFAGGSFLSGGGIKTFNVAKGILSDSIIAAPTIGSIVIGGFVPENGGDAFGILLDAAPKTVAIGGFTYNKGGLPEQISGDFRIKVI